MPNAPERQQRLTLAYYFCQLATIGILARRSVPGWQPSVSGRFTLIRSALLLAAAAITLWVSIRFLIDVASPVILHLPYHRCLYDLVRSAPESGVAMGLLLWGTFCVGWTCVLAWLAKGPGLAAELRLWPAYALVGYLGSVVMISLELWLA